MQPFVITALTDAVSRERVRGLLIGTAVGDSLGLPTEGLSPCRRAKLFPGPWRQRFLPNWGMVSDDTDHTVFVAESLLVAPNAPRRFRANLAGKLRSWLLTLPPGIGWGTLRAILKLWLWIPPPYSAVYSAGNGPAMRAAPLGILDDLTQVAEFVHHSTILTHRDPRAEVGAQAIALCAHLALRMPPNAPPPEKLAQQLAALAPKDMEWQQRVLQMKQGWRSEQPAQQFAQMTMGGTGVSGYVYHSVPMAIYCWRRYWGDFETALSAALDGGGDTDTVGAMTGALVGAQVGVAGIPTDWVSQIYDFPHGISHLRYLADALVNQRERPPRSWISLLWRIPIFWLWTVPIWWLNAFLMLSLRLSFPLLSSLFWRWPLLVIRNLFFLLIVLSHGIRRLLPPY